MRPTRVVLLILPLLVLCAGCQTGDVLMKVPISGGGEIVVPVTGGGPKPGHAAGYTVDVASLEPGTQTREAYYKFGLVCAQAPALRRIRIEDISDEKPVVLIDDRNPKFKDRHWAENTAMISADDPRFRWVYQITMSMRVYKFTLTLSNGSHVSFNHVTIYPPFVKSIIRAKWGAKY